MKYGLYMNVVLLDLGLGLCLDLGFVGVCVGACVLVTKYSLYKCTVYTVHCTVYILQYTVYTIHCTLYIVQCTLCRSNGDLCTLYYYTVCIAIYCADLHVYCTMYTE